MPIVISRTGESDLKAVQVPQEMRDALWAAFVTNWIDKNPDKFASMLADPKPVHT